MKLKYLILIFLTGLFFIFDTEAQVPQSFRHSNHKLGFLNANGDTIVTPVYADVFDFSEGMAAVKREGKWGYITVEGIEVISPAYDETWKFFQGLAAVKLNQKWGFIDQTGKLIIPFQFDEILGWHYKCVTGKLAFVRKGQKKYWIDRSGKELKVPSYTPEVK